MKLTKMNKKEFFKQEFEHIVSPRIKDFAEKAVETLPEYFFHVGASSSGKYHPAYALGEGGLVRHVRAAIRIAVELFRMDMFKYFSADEKDLIIVALLLHDGAKSGIVQGQFTVFDHPFIIAEYIKNHPDLQNILTEDEMNLMLGGISRHMGQWTKNNFGQEILEKPSNKFENMVHLVDYLGSRKMLEMNFDVPVSRE
jgi:hypothetical protein